MDNQGTAMLQGHQKWEVNFRASSHLVCPIISVFYVLWQLLYPLTHLASSRSDFLCSDSHTAGHSCIIEMPGLLFTF